MRDGYSANRMLWLLMQTSVSRVVDHQMSSKTTSQAANEHLLLSPFAGPSEHHLRKEISAAVSPDAELQGIFLEAGASGGFAIFALFLFPCSCKNNVLRSNFSAEPASRAHEQRTRAIDCMVGFVVSQLVHRQRAIPTCEA